MTEKKTKTYDVGDATIVSPENEETSLSLTFEVETSEDSDDEYLDMIFGSAE